MASTPSLKASNLVLFMCLKWINIVLCRGYLLKTTILVLKIKFKKSTVYNNSFAQSASVSMKILTQILVLVMFCFTGYGQTINGHIRGTVVDGTTKQGIEYATVVVINTLNNTVITGGTTDGTGAFLIKDIPAGQYRVTIESIGYKRDTLSNIVIAKEHSEVKLNTISLNSSQHTLKDVTITAALPTVENKIDKIVYNTANDITSQGGAAIDVLKKVPQVGVDADGNVDIQGNGNIRFLLNGKPSSMFNSPVDALAAIPASQIKSIEVITSPGAKYDAEGTGGIINIILKENKLSGINGSVSVSAGTRLENTAINLGMKRGNFGVNAFFSGNAQLISRTPSSQNRVSDTTLHFNQSGYSDFQRQGFQSGIGCDWSINKQSSITANVGYNYVANHSTIYYNQEQYTQSGAQPLVDDMKSVRYASSAYQNNTIELAVAYKKTFKKEGQELDVRYSSSFGVPVSDYGLTQDSGKAGAPFNGSSSHSPGTDRETDIGVDYTHPVSKNVTLETGVKTVLQNIYSDASVYTLNSGNEVYAPDTTQSYQLNYDRRIYAGYVSGDFSFGKFKMKGGLRYERTDTKIDFPNTTIPSYNSFVPSVVFMRELKNDQTVKLSYSHRIERPSYGLLNPFVNRSDPYNITTGNPLLQPEIGDNIELSYYKPLNKVTNITFSLFERMDIQDMKPVTLFYPTYKVGDSVYSNVSVTNQQNVGEEYVTGVTCYASSTIKDKLNGHIFMLFSQRYVISPLAPNGSVIGYRFRGNMNVSYQLPKNLVVEGFVNYNSAQKLLQGEIPQQLTYTFACRKQFWNKNASVGVTATNIFSKYIRQVTTVTAENYVSYNVRELPYRSVGISFTYKFGKYDFKKSKDDSYLNNLPE